jgi:predicted N-acetyltransferase YhbS
MYPKAYTMVLELQPGVLPELAGTIIYPPAFENAS